MDQIFRIDGVVNRDPNVDIWLNGKPGELGSMAQYWFNEMRSCGHDVREVIHDGCPVACIEDAPFAYVNVFKSHVNVGFFMGAHLRDPNRLLEGTGKNGRHVKLKPGGPVDSAALRKLIEAAYWDIKARLGVG